MVMPDQNAKLVVVEAGQGSYIRLATHTIFQHGVERYCAIAHNGQPVAAHLAEHPKDVEHGQINTARGQTTKSGKIRLILELEGPSERSFEVHTVLVSQILLPHETGGSVAGVH